MVATTQEPTTRPVGRPSVSFDTNSGHILEELRNGLSEFAACRKVGVAFFTYRFWIRNGTGPDSREPYRTFARSVHDILDTIPRNPEYNAEVLLPRGRKPQKLSVEQRNAILECTRNGGTLYEAATSAGIQLNTLLSWLRTGGYPRQVSRHSVIPLNHVEEPYGSFVQDFLAAEADAARLLIQSLDDEGDGE